MVKVLRYINVTEKLGGLHLCCNERWWIRSWLKMKYVKNQNKFESKVGTFVVGPFVISAHYNVEVGWCFATRMLWNYSKHSARLFVPKKKKGKQKDMQRC